MLLPKMCLRIGSKVVVDLSCFLDLYFSRQFRVSSRALVGGRVNSLAANWGSVASEEGGFGRYLVLRFSDCAAHQRLRCELLSNRLTWSDTVVCVLYTHMMGVAPDLVLLGNHLLMI